MWLSVTKAIGYILAESYFAVVVGYIVITLKKGWPYSKGA